MSKTEAIARLVKVKIAQIEQFQSKIINGDVIQELKKLNKNHKFDVIIIDPPCNIGKDFGNNNDTMEMGEYIKWSKKWLNLCLWFP
jgi:site-specific DNA-methyltransferase (adenine-specific)